MNETTFYHLEEKKKVDKKKRAPLFTDNQTHVIIIVGKKWKRGENHATHFYLMVAFSLIIITIFKSHFLESKIYN
jgi:hypothetical protein